MGQLSGKQKSYTAEIIIGVGYIIFFCLLVILAYSGFIFLSLNSSTQQSAPINNLATSLPPITPTPHINLTEQSHASKIFTDDFSTNVNDWAYISDERRIAITDGKLIIESKKDGWNVYTSCGKCPSLDKPFYLQADLSTSKLTDQSIGIFFNSDDFTGGYFLFEINTEAQKYYLYYHTNNGWSLRMSGESDQINTFPSVNVIGIAPNQDTVEFYINGNFINSYKESGYVFQKGDFGFYANNSGMQLIVDNLTITVIGK